MGNSWTPKNHVSSPQHAHHGHHGFFNNNAYGNSLSSQFAHSLDGNMHTQQQQQQHQSPSQHHHQHQPTAKELKKYAEPSTVHSNYVEYSSQEPTLIIAPYMYLGGAHVNRNPHLTDYLGITHILNMAVELRPHDELNNHASIKYMHMHADDSLSYNIRHHFDDAFKFIDDARFSGGKILVHCMMGISRSGNYIFGCISLFVKVVQVAFSYHAASVFFQFFYAC
jgi:hypothetical protein